DARIWAAPEPGESQPKEEATPRETPAASALIGRSTLSPSTGARLEVALALLDVLFQSNRRGEVEIVKDWHVRGFKPQAGVARGELLFVKEWVPNDLMSHGGDGLGPVYNETSCVA